MAIFEVMMISLLVLVLYWSTRRGRNPSEPTVWPVVGMLPSNLLNLRRLHDYTAEVLTECGGTYNFIGPWFGNMDMLVTSDPANIHHVLSKHFSNYPKGPEFRKIFDMYRDGMFTSDFELWEIHRKTTQAQLTHPDFYTYLEEAVWEKVEIGLIPVLDHVCGGGGDVDLQDIFQRFAFDNICKLVLGYDPCSLCVELPHVPCEKAFNATAEAQLHRHVLPEWVWKLQKWLNVGSERKLMEASQAFDDFIYPHVAVKDKGEMLKAFEEVYRLDKSNIITAASVTDFLRDTTLSFMLAGRDTSSTCLTWLFYLLALNPCALDKIREEIDSNLVKNKWRRFTAEESQNLVYLHGALCESLRLFPPVALEHKAPVKADVLPSGHRLDKNARVIISFYAVGRMETVWGKDCLEFKPERWISVDGKIKHVPSHKFPAFNTGPRSCLGKGMAFVLMKMVAATMIYHYNIELVEGHPVAPSSSIVLTATHGLRARLSNKT